MNKKIFISLGIALLLLVAQFGTALAAQEPPPITGAVDNIELVTDATTGETMVVVTLLDPATNTTQMLRLSLEAAAGLGLVSTDLATGQTTVNAAALKTTVQIDPALVLTDSPTQEEAQHPVGSALADFFGELFGVDYETVMDYHADGVGFGVIAQALWMTERLEGDTETFEMILDAKQNGDYSVVTLTDGSTPQNWGQFRKAVLGTGKKENLGTIMSDRENTDNPAQVQQNPNQNRNQNSNKDKNKDKEKNKNKP